LVANACMGAIFATARRGKTIVPVTDICTSEETGRPVEALCYQ
jgi:hypothetical protein